MKKFTLIIFLLISFTAFSQLNKGKYVGNDGSTKNFEFYDGSGNLIPIGYNPNIEGTPMLNNSVGFGNILFQNNVKLVDSSVNFSLVDNKIYFIRTNKFYLINQGVKEFTIQYFQDSTKNRIYHFRSGYPNIENLSNSTLYELVYEGNTFHLLKWQHKKVEEHANYGSTSDKAYVNEIVYFLYLPDNNSIVKLGMKISKTDLKKYLPNYALKIDQYISEHKMNFKIESDLVSLFQFLESK